MEKVPIHAWCDARGLSLTELARQAHLPLPAVSDYARGKRNPTLRSIAALASALEVPCWVLLRGPEPGEGLPSAQEARQANLDWFRSLTPSQRVRAAEANRRFAHRASLFARSFHRRPEP
jgi:transcriptional regulator with XRE-family HTH domain